MDNIVRKIKVFVRDFDWKEIAYVLPKDSDCESMAKNGVHVVVKRTAGKIDRHGFPGTNTKITHYYPPNSIIRFEIEEEEYDG